MQFSVLKPRNITSNSLLAVISKLAENGTQPDVSLSSAFQNFLTNLNYENKLKAEGECHLFLSEVTPLSFYATKRPCIDPLTFH